MAITLNREAYTEFRCFGIPDEYPKNIRGAVTELRRRGYDVSESLLQYLVEEGLVRPFEGDRWDEAAIDAAAQELDELGSYTSETLVFQYLGVDATDYFRALHEAWDRVRTEFGDAATPVKPNVDCFILSVPVQPHPERGKSVQRIFELYSGGDQTFKSLADQMQREGHSFRASQPRFHRTALSYILNNRFYIGELRRNGQVFEGKYERLVDRAQFDACQEILHGRNRRTGSPIFPVGGGLLTCAFCGQSITGERVLRKLRSGGVREHIYYRCANNSPGPEHPTVRWKAADLEQAIVDDLKRLRIPSPELSQRFRSALEANLTDLLSHQRRRSAALTKRKSELAAMQDRLLNAYLAGTVDEEAFQAKSAELKADAARVAEELDGLGEVDPQRGKAALAVFDWSQRAAETWLGSNNADRRQILDAVCLNRQVTDVTLVTIKRKPFDFLAERLDLKNSRGDRTSIELFSGSFREWSKSLIAVAQSLAT